MQQELLTSAIALSLSVVVSSQSAQAQTVIVQTGQTLTGDPDAVEISDFGLVANLGTIAGAFNGVEFVNGLGSGLLLNLDSATITSDSRAVNIGGPVDMTNLGAILGTGDQRNGTIYSDSIANSFRVVNRGTIDAGAGNQGSGAAFEIGGSNSAVIGNFGTIAGRTNTPGVAANSGLSGDGLRLNNFGPLGEAEQRVFTGTLFNGGQITSESVSGPIAGVRIGDTVGFQGFFLNAFGGDIFGVRNGLYFGNGDHTGSEAINAPTSRIRSDSRALNIDGLGLNFASSGEILGTGNQRNGTIYSDSTAQGFLLQNLVGGVVDAGDGFEGAAFSAELAEAGNQFTLRNFGEWLGRGDAPAGLGTAGDGIRLERTRVLGALDGTTTGLFTGLIENFGTISSEGDNGTVGAFRAVNGVSFQGTLDNSGVFAGVRNGVYFGNPTPAGGGNHTTGVVNNLASGVISSDSRAFNLDGLGLTVNNEGQMLATGPQRNGTFYVDGTADNFRLDNSGLISAEGGAGSGVSIQVGSFSEDAQFGKILNSGEITGSGDFQEDAGIRMFTADPGASFTGNVLNSESGVIRGGQEAAGVLVEDGVNFTGIVVNLGLIDGGIDMATGSLQLSNSSVLRLEISGQGAGEFDRILVGDTAVLDGELQIVYTDGFFAPESDFANAFAESMFLEAGTVVGNFDRVVVNGAVFSSGI